MAKKRYRVTGGSVVFGKEKGEEFEAELTEFEEWHLKASGNAVPVDDKKNGKEK